LKGVQAGFFLRKKPLECLLSAYIASESAIGGQPSGWIVDCTNYQYSQLRANPSGQSCTQIVTERRIERQLQPTPRRLWHGCLSAAPNRIDVNGCKESRGGRATALSAFLGRLENRDWLSLPGGRAAWMERPDSASMLKMR
jgi:hypothetical protein